MRPDKTALIETLDMSEGMVEGVFQDSAATNTKGPWPGFSGEL